MRRFESKLLYLFVLTLLFGAAVPAVGVTISSAPSNDNCANATPVGNVSSLSFNTTEATPDGPQLCMRSPNIWYCYTAPSSGCVTVSLNGSSYDTRLAVYDGCGCTLPISKLLACNDDFGANHWSQVTFPATAGKQYLIEVGGYGTVTGQGKLSIYLESGLLPPANDNCLNAIPLVGNVTNLSFDTRCASFDGPGRCSTITISPNIWYRYTATCTGNVTISLQGSQYDTALAVYNSTTCYPSSSNLIDCNDDYYGQQSRIVFSAVAGHQYLVEVGGYYKETGTGVMNITCQGQPSQNNDNCQNAKPVVSDVSGLSFDTTQATFDGPPGHYITSPNLWYCYTATCTGDVTVSLCGSSFDTKLAVYKGCQCYPQAGSEYAFNDDYCNLQSQVTFAATTGSQYLIEVGGYGSLTGQGVLSISCAGPVNVYDLGDAPDSTNNKAKIMSAYPSGGPGGVQANYPTVFNDGSGLGPYGPIHSQPSAVAYLGAKVTTESEADAGLDQDVTNNIVPLTNTPNKDGGDDGVTVPINLPSCKWSTFDYTVNVVTPRELLFVNVWFDWNRDGDWDDILTCSQGSPAPEWAVQNQVLANLPVGTNKITTPAFLPWHPTTGTKQIWMRITLSEKPWWIDPSLPKVLGSGGSGPADGYEVGETEDYYFVPGTTSPSICEDLNGDGKIDYLDLNILVDQWLGSCLQQ